jgi:hypothetical protein
VPQGFASEILEAAPTLLGRINLLWEGTRRSTILAAMTLEQFSSLAQIIGAIAVLASLIFVGLQIRQNTQSQHAFNNLDGNIVADPYTHNVYDIYAAGETGVLKPQTFTPNHIIVSRSTDMGKSWTANLVLPHPQAPN